MERASHDPKVVMTTYEGRHDHDIPAARTVTCNPAGTDSATIVQNDGARTKSEEGAAGSADAAIKVESSDHPSELTMRQNDEPGNKCNATRSSTLECESKSEEQQQGEPSSPCKSPGETDSVPQSRSTEEQSKNQLTAKLEESDGVNLDEVGKKPNEQQEILSSAAVQT